MSLFKLQEKKLPIKNQVLKQNWLKNNKILQLNLIKNCPDIKKV